VFTENKIKILSRPWTVNVRDARLFVTNDSGNAFFRTTDRCGCHLQRTPTKKTDKNCFVDSKLLRRPRLDRKLCRRLFRPGCQLVTVHNNLFDCVRANSENVSVFAVVFDNSSSVSNRCRFRGSINTREGANSRVHSRISLGRIPRPSAVMTAVFIN
jgi:hypothetical protein